MHNAPKALVNLAKLVIEAQDFTASTAKPTYFLLGTPSQVVEHIVVRFGLCTMDVKIFRHGVISSMGETLINSDLQRTDVPIGTAINNNFEQPSKVG